MDQLWLIYGLIFGAVLLAFQALYYYAFRGRREQAAINRRVALTAQLNNPSEVLEVLRRERGVEFLGQFPGLDGLNMLIIQSGIRRPGFLFILVPIGLAVVFFLILRLALASDFLALLLCIPLSLGAAFVYLRLIRGRRIAAFGEQFPDALDTLVRGLRAGHPFRVAVGLVAREMPDPIGSEFGIVADEVMFGLDQNTAIDNLCARVGQVDLAFFATAVNVQQQTGGNLAEILSRLSGLLRSRSKLRLKIRALSGEGRLSGIALSLAPFVLFGIITLLSPEYFSSVRNHPIIPFVTTFAVALLIVGNIVMYRMINFKF
jgi:tight adherence protein B